MRYFFIPPNFIQENRIQFPASEAHHLKEVLRFTKGDHCQVLDGQGFQYEVELEEVGVQVVGRVLKKEKRQMSSFPICVAQAIPQKGRMEIIAEKAAELGILKFLPMITEYSQVRPKAEEALKMIKRWQRIVEQTVKQSHLHFIPEIALPVKLEKLNFKDYSHVLLFHPDPKAMSWPELASRLKAKLPQAPVLVLIGPEGGFSDQECEMLQKQGAQMIRLHEEVLKTDTAFVAIVSLLKYSFERN